MSKNIQELHKLIIDSGRSGDATKLNVGGISESELLRHPLPVGKESRRDFLKGLVLLENGLRLGSTSPLHNFMKRLDLIIKNTYRALMTRGTKGCYVYFADKETEKYFRDSLEQQRSGNEEEA